MKISIVIPNYNYEKYIGKTIESVINQSYPDKEIIVIDDGSTDNSWEIISQYKNLYPSLFKIFRQVNKGQVSAINEGLKHATGDVIGWINSDDTYCGNSFNAVMNEFMANVNVNVLIGNINYIDQNDNFIFTLRHFKFSYFKSVFLGFGNTMSSNATFWRKELLDKSGLLNPDYKCGLDSEFFSRLTKDENVFYLNLTLANFRQQEITKAAIGNPKWDDLVRLESNRVFYESYEKLKLSKCLPFSIGKYLRPLMLINRRILKIISGRYFKSQFEKYKYKHL